MVMLSVTINIIVDVVVVVVVRWKATADVVVVIGAENS